MTKVCLSQQNYVCCDKNDTCIILSRQKTCFVATKLFTHRNLIFKHVFVTTDFVTTKSVLVAAPTSDTPQFPVGMSETQFTPNWLTLDHVQYL